MKRLLAFLLVVIVSFGVIAATTPALLDKTKLGLDLKGGFEILYEAQPLTPGGTVSKKLLNQTAISLEQRANKSGVGEPEVTTEGKNRIRVKIAGVADQEKLRDLMKKPADLQFRSAYGCPADTKADHGYCKVELVGSDFVENAAKVMYDQLNRPIIEIKVKDKKKFAEITKRLSTPMPQPLAIYLDDVLISDPAVQQELSDGSATITGQPDRQSADKLAEIINLGALPLKLTEKYTQSVGATLGKQSLHETLFAGALASVLILLFMLVFYRLPGLVATICLIVYVWVLLGVFYFMGATLTLPGIAAFILGIGIAVDSNIIIAERIKDELRSGKTLPSSLRAGSKNSFRTVIDAHITNVIAGVVLYFMGQGMVKGFAIVLVWSIVINILTNVFLPRLLLQLLIQSGRFTKLGYYGVKESEIRAL
ncbi:protein translocase subunit SecD [Cohnella pontilimi]|uniref:Protein translocase subunit SecD n=1 Tax=Cohnella pontilimi TaxID=2564100 RepID=A0A4U0F9M4_9BACL|nr:protein translocase subunit SecD [Cohnella pontilimi]TJY41415.1 protein translocase subunit SecD [Cohnella pontilimi]